MKRFMTIAAIISVSVVLSGCPSAYQKSINNDLKIPYVYIPPNNAYHPFTLLQYTKSGGFQQICNATTITELTEQEIESKKAENEIATLEVKKNHKAEYNINISKDEIGNANIKYTNIKKVELSFENGKQVSIPSVHVSDAVKNVESSKCKDDIKLFASEIQNSEFFIPTVVFSYDMKYHVIDKDGIDVTAELSKELSKVVLGKIGINYEGDSDLHMSSNDLYIGFRGLPLKASLINILDGVEQKVFMVYGAPKANTVKNITLDVTDIVRRISME